MNRTTIIFGTLVICILYANRTLTAQNNAVEKVVWLYEHGEYKKAVALSDSLFAHAGNSDREDSLNHVLSLTYGKGLFELSQYVKSVTFLQEYINNPYLKDDLHKAEVLGLMAKNYDFMQHPEESIIFYKEAIELTQNQLGPDHEKLATLYNGLGEVYRYTLKNYKLAREALVEAARILEKNHAGNLWAVYYNLASSTRFLDDPEEALSYAFGAVSQLSKAEAIDSARLFQTYNLIANIYFSNNESAKAIYYNKLILQNGEKDPVDKARLLNNLSFYYEAADSAMLYIDQALALLRNVPASVSRDKVLRGSYFAKASIYDENKNFPAALKYYDKCIQIANSKLNGNHEWKKAPYGKKGKLYLKLHNFDSAIYNFKKGISPTGNMGSDYLLTNSYTEYGYVSLLAGCYLKKGNDVKAEEYFNLSLAMLEKYSQEQQRQGSRMQVVARNHILYENALQFTFLRYQSTDDQAYLYKAYETIERSKSRLLLERLTELSNYTNFGLPPPVIDSLKDLDGMLLFKQKRLLRMQSRFPHSDSGYLAAQRDYIKGKRKHTNFKLRLKRDYPGFYNLKLAKQWLDFDSLKARVGGCLDYFWGDSNIYVLGFSKKALIFNKIPVTEGETLVKKYRQLITKGIDTGSLLTDFQSYNQVAYDLYEQFIGIPANKLPKELLIMPDGWLNKIPFESFVTSKAEDGSVDYAAPDYLIKQTSVRYASSSKLAFGNKENAMSTGRVLAFGYSAENDRRALKGSMEEIQAIQQLMPGEYFIGDNAKKETFVAKLAGFDILHLAIHGFSQEGPVNSNWLEFPTGSKIQRRLSDAEIYGLSIPADLVVLSACESGLGRLTKGEGVQSISRAFAYAGSEGIIMSLWKITDKSSAALMTTFYSNLNKKHLSSHEALRQAQLNHLSNSDGLSAHPNLWAGFIHSGQPIIIKKASANIYYWLIGGALLVALTLFFIARARTQNT